MFTLPNWLAGLRWATSAADSSRSPFCSGLMFSARSSLWPISCVTSIDSVVLVASLCE